MKVLFLDIETAPSLAHVWGIWQQDIAINQIMESGYVLCWSAKWYRGETLYSSNFEDGYLGMLSKIHALLDEADVVVHYNGKSFDIPTLNREFVIHKMKPPAPYKEVDLLQAVRSRFRFPSNKLEYVAKALGIGHKIKHSGHELWVRCMNGEPEAWQEMKKYNIRDTELLEDLYNKLQPWVRNLPHFGNYAESDRDHLSCPTCGDTRLQSRGTYKTAMQVYQRYQCQGCGSWSRSVATIKQPKLKLKGAL
jgi:uncharacterized protein YprB with RNaseH-like and TPR domain/predicted RNA-binding Zn-ribbon protein involved in translation (DUF1610 family)